MKKRKYSIPPAVPPSRPPAISVPRQARLPAAHTYDHWTAEEERLLGTRPDREVAQLLHRTVRAIESQRHRLGIYRQPSIQLKARRWKPAELALLGTRIDSKLADRLGRTESSVGIQRRKLGIPAFGQWHPPSARGKPEKPDPRKHPPVDPENSSWNHGIHGIHGKRTAYNAMSVHLAGERPSVVISRSFREGMSFVTGAPWDTQDAVAERTGTVAP